MWIFLTTRVQVCVFRYVFVFTLSIGTPNIMYKSKHPVNSFDFDLIEPCLQLQPSMILGEQLIC